MTRSTSPDPQAPVDDPVDTPAPEAQDMVATLMEQGLALHQQGMLAEARSVYGKVLQAEPAHFDALNALGMLLHQSGDSAGAIVLLDQAIAVDPDAAVSWNNRGVALQELGQLDEALACYDRLVTQDSNNPHTWFNRGVVLKKLSRLAEAVASYSRAIKIHPQYAQAHNNLGLVYKALKRLDQALICHDRAIAIEPGFAAAHNNRGIALQELHRFEEALASYNQAIAIDANHADAWFNRGVALYELQRMEESLQSYDAAIALKPGNTDAWFNRGVVLQALCRTDEALASYEKIIGINSGYRDAYWNQSLALLTLGQFKKGWALYETRWTNPRSGLQLRKFAQPVWLGAEPLQGKTILLHAEQGLGDTIQFCRYALPVSALGATVVVDVPSALAGLLQTLDGVHTLVADGKGLPHFDYHCPLLSLPLALNTELHSIPCTEAYLKSDAVKRDAWSKRLGSTTRPRIGLVWSGSNGHKNDQRSMGLASLLAHLPDGCDYISLQKEVRATDQEALERSGIPHFGDALHDFADTAALCDLMDLVVSIDTSVAHLAAALGKPTWILLPFASDWRWMTGRSDSPWYASATLYRQERAQDWASVVQRLGQDIAQRFGVPGTAPKLPSPAQAVGQPTASANDQALADLLDQAVSLHRQGQLAPAKAVYEQMLTLRAQHFDALHLLGMLHCQTGEPSLAIPLFERAIAVNPGVPDAYNNCGFALQELGRVSEALACYDQWIAVDAGSAQAHFNRGVVLKKLDRLEEATAAYEAAVTIRPDYAEAHNNLGSVFKALERYDQALACHERALAIQPRLAKAHNNRGIALQGLKRFEEALVSYDQALALEPGYADAWFNRGVALNALGRLDEALASYERTLALNPDNQDARWNTALCMLLMGQFRRGWEEYECRWKNPGVQVRSFAQPLWLGKAPLQDKTILLHAEQGFGDIIQFCRYARAVSELGARVVLDVPAALAGLLNTLSGVHALVTDSQNLPDFDLHCPLLSLPLAFNTELHTIPGAEAYLQSDAHKRSAWEARLGTKTRPRIGLVWSGSTGHTNDQHRSLRLESLLAYLPAGCDYISLQKEVRASDLDALQRSGILYVGDELRDFGDTAALCDLVDLVVSVDTSVAHLAAALGKPTWILLSFVPDWRWLMDRSDSPWYASVTLYRQPRIREWAPVLQQIAADLVRRFDLPPGLYAPNVSAARGSAMVPLTSTTTVPAAATPRLPVVPVLHGSVNEKALDALTDQALALHRQGKLAEAQAIYEQVLQQQANHFDALQLLGTLLSQTRQSDQAMELLRRAIAVRPQEPAPRNNLGVLLNHLQRHEEALDNYNALTGIHPGYADAWFNRGIALQALNRFDEALVSYDQAIALRPDHVDTWFNRGVAFSTLGRLHAALASYEQAIAINPDNQDVRWNTALCLLLMGHFQRGWEFHESRWHSAKLGVPSRQFAQDLWLGQEPLQDKTILLHAEQGLGDIIQFCRYAQAVSALGATVVLEVPVVLAPLLRKLPGVHTLVTAGDTLSAFDWQCPLLSLPLAFKTELHTIPCTTAYLKSDADKRSAWSERLGAKTRPRIGLVWSGSNNQINDQRSLALGSLLAHLPDGCDYISLQKQVHAVDRDALKRSGMPHFGDELRDFADTAALCDLMDLVISVDTSVAHLSGALGQTTWLLLPFVPDWRWLMDRSDSPWYASVTLYRQPQRQQWDPVLERLAADLAQRFGLQARPRSAPISNAPGTPHPNPPAQAAHPASAEEKALDPLLDQALALHRQGQLAQARVVYEKVLQQQARHFDALQLLGVLLHQTQQSTRALDFLRRAIAVRPQEPAPWNNLGVVLNELQRFGEALENYHTLTAAHPGYADAWFNQGIALRGLGRMQEAVASFDRAVAINPNHADAWNNRGVVLQTLDRLEDALYSLDKAIALQPGVASTWNNRGTVLQHLRQHKEALESFHKALALNPDYHEVHWNLSLCLLTMGEFERGWELYEWRWKNNRPGLKLPDFAQPLWLGEQALAGKTILLHAEQGLGDTIQFSRYAPLVSRMGARVLLGVPAALAGLLRPLPGVDMVLGQGQELPEFDWQCPLLSLPLAFKTALHTIPTPGGYLHSKADKRSDWSARLGAQTRPRIGLVWSGSTIHKNDHHRSLGLQNLLDHLPAGCDYISLQKEVRAADQDALQRSGILHFGDDLHDFGDTAALCDLMDLVISVDTSVAHLAGALGKPTWILLPFVPDWRWMLDRDDSPWYTSVTLYRQARDLQWTPVLERLAADLVQRFALPPNHPPPLP